jgi:hypothetical protein
MVVHFSILDFLLLNYDYFLYYNIVILSKLLGKLIQFQKLFIQLKTWSLMWNLTFWTNLTLKQVKLVVNQTIKQSIGPSSLVLEGILKIKCELSLSIEINMLN